MKKTISGFLLLLLCAALLTVFALWPKAAFMALDINILSSPRARNTEAKGLSEEGSKIELVKTMFNRKNIYGKRFLNWKPAEFKPDDIITLKKVLENLYEYDIVSQQTIDYIDVFLLTPENYDAQKFTDEINFVRYNISSVSSDVCVNLAVEIEPKNNYAVSVQLLLPEEAELITPLCNNYLKYAGLNELTDWQARNVYNASPKGEAKFSESAQLYVYAQSINENNIYCEIYPMTEEEFLSLS